MRYLSVITLLFLLPLTITAQPTSGEYGILYSHSDSLQYETYPVPEGWGYRLYYRYQLKVIQPTIPAIGGNQAFKSEKEAKAVASLAISKMAKGIVPPTLTVEEIKNVLNNHE